MPAGVLNKVNSLWTKRTCQAATKCKWSSYMIKFYDYMTKLFCLHDFITILRTSHTFIMSYDVIWLIQLWGFFVFVFSKSLYRMVVSVYMYIYIYIYIYIFTEYIKITAFEKSPVKRQVETIASSGRN